MPGARTLDRPTQVKDHSASAAPRCFGTSDGVIMFLRLDNVIGCAGLFKGDGRPGLTVDFRRAIRVGPRRPEP